MAAKPDACKGFRAVLPALPKDGAETDIDTLSARLRAAESACAAKDSFIAAISRELNNPLSPVLLAVEHLRALLQSGDAARTEAAMRLLERATEGFARRTRLLLDLADLTSGAAQVTLSNIDVSDLVERVAEDHGDMARLAGCPLVLAIAPGLRAWGNAEALSQVLGHLLANAFRFGAGKPVQISAARDVGAVVIGISDQGPGIAADKEARLFALFQHARTTREPGLGVGLWVAAEWMGAMGGSIGIESRPGAGAHFRVSLQGPNEASVAPATQNLQIDQQPGA